MKDTDDNIIKYFQKHMVLLCAVFTTEEKAATYVATCFVLAVKNEWFLVTAGHVALEIKEYMQNKKYCLEKAFLIDYGGHCANHPEPIPFYLKSNRLVVLGDEKTHDYAFIIPNPYYIRLLKANGIEPLNELVWNNQPQVFDFYMILGVPRKFVSPKWNNSYSEISKMEI